MFFSVFTFHFQRLNSMFCFRRPKKYSVLKIKRLPSAPVTVNLNDQSLMKILGATQTHRKSKQLKPTFKPARLLGPVSRDAAVKAEVTVAVNMAIMIRPDMIQMMENIRAAIDLGDLSPYLDRGGKHKTV